MAAPPLSPSISVAIQPQCAEVVSNGVCCRSATHVVLIQIKDGLGRVYSCEKHAAKMAARAGTQELAL